jgi:hypothetical protein
MPDTWKTALVMFVGTFVTALISAGKMPSEMATMGWYDALFGPVLQSVLMSLGSFGYAAPPVRHVMGLKQ